MQFKAGKFPHLFQNTKVVTFPNLHCLPFQAFARPLWSSAIGSFLSRFVKQLWVISHWSSFLKRLPIMSRKPPQHRAAGPTMAPTVTFWIFSPQCTSQDITNIQFQHILTLLGLHRVQSMKNRLVYICTKNTQQRIAGLMLKCILCCALLVHVKTSLFFIFWDTLAHCGPLHSGIGQRPA